MHAKFHTHKGFLKQVLLFGIAAGFFFSGVIALWAASLDIPDLNTILDEDRAVEQSTKIYDRTGEILLYDLHKNIKRTAVPYDAISPHVKNASVAIEDAHFFEHAGVDPSAVLRATIVNVLSFGYEQGGSTITQQVVKNSLLTQKKTIARKLKEWILALKLERVVSKEQILELYLNEVPYGGSIYGVEEASRAYFGKHANELSIAESAYLAALPQAPTYYLNNPDKFEERKNTVLEQMHAAGSISKAELEQAHEETVRLAPQTSQEIQAPHLVFYVIEQLEKKYGKEFIETRGLRITTTLDLELQKKAEQIVTKYGEINERKFNAKNAGMIAVDPKTGQILVMVGSRDYFNTEREGNFNVTIHPNRQPGSSFKPFVYATALKKGYTPETVVFDAQTQFHSGCDWEGNPVDPGVSEDDCYQPVNYDDTYRGPVTFREALAQSINLPAIKVLYLAGLRDSLETAEAMGVSSLAGANRYGLTLVLGGGEVSLIEMTDAYGTFANDGMRSPHTAILRVTDASGRVLDEFSSNPRRAIDTQTARQITDMLSDNEARAAAFGYYSPLHFPGYDVAAKTGTTNDYKDMWIIGYTPNIAVGAWAGNNDFTSMSKEVAGFVVAPMWNKFMKAALAAGKDGEFKEPAPIANYADLKPILRGIWRGSETYFIDTISGKRATQYTPEETKEERVVTNVHSILYWLDPDNPRGEKPENPEKDPQFVLWETPVQKWADKNNYTPEDSAIPQEADPVHTPQNAPSVSLYGIKDGSAYNRNEQVSLAIETSGVYPLKRADIFVNNNLIQTLVNKPLTYSFVPAGISATQQNNVLRVVVYDSVMNKAAVDVSFSVK